MEVDEFTLTLLMPGRDQLPVIAVTLAVWSFIVGSTVGSFLNVVIARVPVGESVVRPRSRCPTCSTQIAWYDNIPIFSWIILRARCRKCGTSISGRYALVELLVGLIATGIYLREGFSFRGAELLLLSTILICIAFIDLETWTIPHVLNLSLVLVGLAFAILGLALGQTVGISLVLDDAGTGVDAAISRGLGAVLGFGVLQAVRVSFTYVFRKTGRLGPDDEAMGAGDPLLLGAMGAVTGAAGLPVLVFLASFQGAIVGGILALAGRLHPGGVPLEDDPEEWAPPAHAIPFGPFLALGGLEVAFFGPTLIEVVQRWVWPVI